MSDVLLWTLAGFFTGSIPFSSSSASFLPKLPSTGNATWKDRTLDRAAVRWF